MDQDLMLVVGGCLAILAVPSLLNGYTEGRVPRLGLIFALLSAGLLGYAQVQSPSGFSLAEVPQAFGRVFSRLIN